MNIEKRGKKYRARMYIDGKMYRITFDKKPGIKEAEKALEQLANKPHENGTLTFKMAAEEMMSAKSNVLSPSTIRGYTNNLKGISAQFKSKKIDSITQMMVQSEVNKIAGRLSAKTTKNYYGFISSVLASYRPDLALKVKLPMEIKKEPYIPTTEDIKALFDYADGTKYKLCLYLGCLGMRRSEICAITDDDITGNQIYIHRAMVQNKNDEWVVKEYTKTASSTRTIYVPDEVVAEIKKMGLYDRHPHTISDWMTRAEKELGLEHFTLHKLRHYFASKSHELGLTDAEIQKAGGWSTDEVMKRVYRHSMSGAEKVSDVLSKELF